MPNAFAKGDHVVTSREIVLLAQRKTIPRETPAVVTRLLPPVLVVRFSDGSFAHLSLSEVRPA